MPICTVGAEMFGVGDFWLKTRIIIKIMTHPRYPRILTNFHGNEGKKKEKKYFFFFQDGRLKKTRILKPPIRKKFRY